jgi:hypothetical protein
MNGRRLSTLGNPLKKNFIKELYTKTNFLKKRYCSNETGRSQEIVK